MRIGRPRSRDGLHTRCGTCSGSLHRVGVLANPADPFTKPFLEQVQLAGRVSGIDIGPIAMGGGADEVDAAFADMVRERARKPSSFPKRSRILR
jgi:hypothetical protein